jgi:cobaltochelatase CobN
MLEAIRKGYWGATRETRQELAARWRELNERHGVDLGAPATRAFVAQIGFGLLPREVDAQPTAGPPQAGEAVRGAVLQPVAAAPARADARWATWLALLLLLACLGAGAAAQIRFNARIGQVP